MSPHLALLNVQLNHVVMVPKSLCGLRISVLGGSLVAGELLWREAKTLIEHSAVRSRLATDEGGSAATEHDNCSHVWINHLTRRR